MTVNGCGADSMPSISKTMTENLPASFTECCNTHDRDYAKCGYDRASADSRLLNCLTTAANAVDSIILQAVPRTFYAAVRVGGGPAYTQAQTDFCQCASPSSPLQASKVNVKVPVKLA